jgi:hypothetical protein
MGKHASQGPSVRGNKYLVLAVTVKVVDVYPLRKVETVREIIAA